MFTMKSRRLWYQAPNPFRAPNNHFLYNDLYTLFFIHNSRVSCSYRQHGIKIITPLSIIAIIQHCKREGEREDSIKIKHRRKVKSSLALRAIGLGIEIGAGARIWICFLFLVPIVDTLEHILIFLEQHCHHFIINISHIHHPLIILLQRQFHLSHLSILSYPFNSPSHSS